MAKTIPDLAKSEWKLMDALWRQGRATASELQTLLEPDQGWAYSTVKTMLDRLVEKGYVKSRRDGNVYEYSPRVKRDAAVSRIMDDVVDRALEGSVVPFIHRMVEQHRLTRGEVQELKDMLDRYEEDGGE